MIVSHWTELRRLSSVFARFVNSFNVYLQHLVHCIVTGGPWRRSVSCCLYMAVRTLSLIAYLIHCAGHILSAACWVSQPIVNVKCDVTAVTSTYVVTLWCSLLSVRVPRCQNYKWRLNPVWHSLTGCFIAAAIWQQWVSKGSGAETHTVCYTHIWFTAFDCSVRDSAVKS